MCHAPKDCLLDPYHANSEDCCPCPEEMKGRMRRMTYRRSNRRLFDADLSAKPTRT